MPIYNLYFMNDRGHIDRIKHVDAASDALAIDSAHEQMGRQPIEIWSQHKKVHRIEPVDHNAMCMMRAPDQQDGRQHSS